MNYLKNFWFLIKSRRHPRLTDAKTERLIREHNQTDYRLVQKLSKQKVPRWSQIKYVSKLLTASEKFRLKILVVIFIVSAIYAGTSYYLNFAEREPAIGGSYTEGLIGVPKYLNPLLAQTNDIDLDINAIVFNGLLKYSSDRGLVPDLAESYTLSDDQKTYTFTLRDNVYWHDGAKLTAADVAFTFNRIKEPGTQSPLYYTFKDVTIDYPDERTVRLSLPQPLAPFIESLTTGIIPEHLWKNVIIDNTHLSELNIKPIGTGPYKFKSFIKDPKTGAIKSYNFVRNDKYFTDSAKIENITFKFYSGFEDAVTALNNKNVAGLSYLPKNNLDSVLNTLSLNLHSLTLPQHTALFFNQSHNTLLKDFVIRRALARAIDKDKIINEILLGQAKKIDSPILEGRLGYTTEITKYPFDQEQAKTELENLGWTLAPYEIAKATNDQENTTTDYPFQVRKKDKKYLEITLVTVNQPENVKIAESIQKDWQVIGVKTNLQFVAPSEIQKTTIKNRAYDILLYGEISGYDPDPYAFWHSSQISAPGLNLALYANKQVDALLSEARTENNPEKRAVNYQKFQKLLADELPAIFLFNPTYTYPQEKSLQGFSTSSIVLPANRFADITDWFIKTKRHLF